MSVYREKAGNVFRWICKYGIWGISAAVLFYMWMLSIFSSSAVELRNFAAPGEEADIAEYSFFVPDRFWIHLVFLAGSVFVCLAVKKSGILRKVSSVWLDRAFFAIFIIAGISFILLTRLQPVSDPGKVLGIARQFLKGDFTAMQTEGYLFRHNHQSGIVLYCYLFSAAAGKYDYLILQLINVGMMAMIIMLMGRIAGLLWGEKSKVLATITKLLYLLFLPSLFYTTLIYGTIPSFFFATAAIYFELKYLKTGSFRNIVPGSLCMGLAIVLKSNSLILCVAMAIFLIYDIVVADKKKLSVLFLLLLWIMQAGCLQITHMAIKGITGVPVSEGMPKLTYVAMSLQESRFAPGTWNGYSVHLYEEAGYDRDKTNEMAMESIKNRLEDFREDKSEAVRWLGRKLAAEWNEPGFGSIDLLKNRPSQKEQSVWLHSLTDGKLKYAVTGYLNILQSLILAGALLYLLLGRRDIRMAELLLMTGFLGGFFFHIAWEAKSQYTVPYFMLLAGYAVNGYRMAAERLGDIFSRGIGKKKLITAGAAAACVIFAVAGLYPTRLFQYMINVRDTDELCGLYRSTVEKNIEEDSLW